MLLLEVPIAGGKLSPVSLPAIFPLRYAPISESHVDFSGGEQGVFSPHVAGMGQGQPMSVYGSLYACIHYLGLRLEYGQSSVAGRGTCGRAFWVVWKIDLHLITALFGVFIFNILDRSNIASARLGGLQTDLKLTDTQYQTAVSIMFVGYLLGQIPSNMVLTKLNPSRYLPVAIFIWGGLSLATAGVHNFSQIFAVRFLIGFAESPFFAGALLLISSWYKPSEIAPRVALMYCGNTVANGFGGVLAAGVLSGFDGASGLEGWRWLYIIEGAGTMLTEQEQRLAEWRIAASANGELDETSSLKQGLIDTVTDIKVWLLVLTQICLLSSQTWTYFFPSIVQTLGYGRIRSLLLTSPVYVFGFFTSLGNSLVAAKTGHRAILVIWPLCLAIVDNSHQTAVRYIGMFLMCAGSFSAFNVLEAWVGSTVPRTRTKRAITYALVNMLGNLSNIYGSYFFPAASAPQYVLGGVVLSSFAAGGVCFAAVLGLYLRRENKRAVEAENEDGVMRYKFLI
ncbi:MFS general substrate transporter [Mollisia scopiformis]|uniref:MFS general substrate transporter n=1 Tax=Mollisia scopiformis TaxID=149040 RepID=A0A194WT07_MOLSC|nr:MFS general substrate transporter [Mollisia scopiformis]KUJ11095.1 MFS general substrate transporter [Mollisia scopiformis]